MIIVAELRKLINILIIDDEINSRDLIVNLLTKYFDVKYQVKTVGNIKESKEILHQNEFDVVFTDSVMPFENTNDLINSKQNKKTQFVLCTALNNTSFTNSFQFPVYFLQKPIDIEDFITICNLIINQIDAFENTLMI